MVKNRSPSREGGCCTVNTLKYLLFIYVFFFFVSQSRRLIDKRSLSLQLSALALLTIGIYTYVTQLHFASLLPNATFVHITYVVILLALVMLLVGVVGCIAVARMSKCALLLARFSRVVSSFIKSLSSLPSACCSCFSCSSLADSTFSSTRIR